MQRLDTMPVRLGPRRLQRPRKNRSRYCHCLTKAVIRRDEYFSDGLSEELIAALGQIKDLKVIGRSSSFRFKDRKEEPKTIGENLGVSTLLEGTVRKQGDKVRIVAELINAADGTELWSRIFDRELKDIFAVQTEIAAAVAESLKVTLLGDRMNSPQTRDAKVQKRTTLISRAIFIFSVVISRTFAKLLAYFDEAIRLDPDYALAYAERAEAWTLIGDLNTEQRATPGRQRRAMRRRPSRSRLTSPRRTRRWVGFAFLSIGSSPKV